MLEFVPPERSGNVLLALAVGYAKAFDKIQSNFGNMSELILRHVAGKQLPIRVLLRETKAYRKHILGEVNINDLSPNAQLAESELIQMARGDIPYFFRNFGCNRIFHYDSEALTFTESNLPENLLNEALPKNIESEEITVMGKWKVKFEKEAVKCVFPSGKKFKFARSLQ